MTDKHRSEGEEVAQSEEEARKKSDFSFHPGALAAINKRAISLLQKVIEHPITPNQARRFPSHRPARATITDKEIVGSPIFREEDIFGHNVSAYFFVSGRQMGLTGESYQDLRQLADLTLKHPGFAISLELHI